MAESKLPGIAEVAGPFFEKASREERPLLVALAERMAAKRYRGWAEAAANEDARSQLLACAEREEEIARRVEALHPEAARVQQSLLEKYPDLEDLYASIFVDRSIRDQHAIQAQGERVGAATWRAFANGTENPAEREVFLACALLEEESATVLESLLE